MWDALGVHCSANERRADEASRDVEAWLKCYFMQDKLGEEFTGVITGVTTFGIFVQLEELYVEGMVHITDLGADYFQYDDARHELKGERSGKRFQLTDRVTVQVVRVDLEMRKIDLRLSGPDAPPPKPEGSGGKDRNKTNIKPGPTTSQRHEVKTSAPKAAADQPASKPKSRSRGGRKNNAAAPAPVAPQAAKSAAKSKKKR